MNLVIVEFQEVLHVHRMSESRSFPEHTVFSFMSSFKYTPYVSVPGSPRLENGMRVAALLRNANDWKSLVGWRDLNTNAIAAPDPRFHLKRFVFLLVWLASLAYFTFRFGLGTLGVNVYLSVFPGLVFGYFAYKEFRAWRMSSSEAKAVALLPQANEA